MDTDLKSIDTNTEEIMAPLKMESNNDLSDDIFRLMELKASLKDLVGKYGTLASSEQKDITLTIDRLLEGVKTTVSTLFNDDIECPVHVYYEKRNTEDVNAIKQKIADMRSFFQSLSTSTVYDEWDKILGWLIIMRRHFLILRNAMLSEPDGDLLNRLIHTHVTGRDLADENSSEMSVLYNNDIRRPRPCQFWFTPRFDANQSEQRLLPGTDGG